MTMTITGTIVPTIAETVTAYHAAATIAERDTIRDTITKCVVSNTLAGKTELANHYAATFRALDHPADGGTANVLFAGTIETAAMAARAYVSAMDYNVATIVAPSANVAQSERIVAAMIDGTMDALSASDRDVAAMVAAMVPSGPAETTKRNTIRKHDGPNRPVAPHIANAFDGAPVGTTMRIRAIRDTESETYGPDDAPSDGAITNVLFDRHTTPAKPRRCPGTNVVGFMDATGNRCGRVVAPSDADAIERADVARDTARKIERANARAAK